MSREHVANDYSRADSLKAMAGLTVAAGLAGLGLYGLSQLSGALEAAAPPLELGNGQQPDFIANHYREIAAYKPRQSGTVNIGIESVVNNVTYYNYTQAAVDENALKALYETIYGLRKEWDFSFSNSRDFARLGWHIATRARWNDSGHLFLIPNDSNLWPYPAEKQHLSPWPAFTAETEEDGFITVIRVPEPQKIEGFEGFKNSQYLNLASAAEACNAVYEVTRSLKYSMPGQEALCTSVALAFMARQDNMGQEDYAGLAQETTISRGFSNPHPSTMVFPAKFCSKIPELTPIIPPAE